MDRRKLGGYLNSDLSGLNSDTNTNRLQSYDMEELEDHSSSSRGLN